MLVPRTKYRHASAAPLAGLIPLRPLHSLPHPPLTVDCSRSFRRPQTAETGKDSGAPQRFQRPRDFVRPRGALRREALPIAEDESNSTARLRPVQGVSIIRETGHFCTASISQATLRRTETAGLTAKFILTDTPALGFAACCLRFDPDARKLAIIPLRSSGGESGKMSSRWRDDAKARVQTPRQNIVSFAAPLSCRNASGTITQHTLSVWSFLPP